ncbi:MAG: alpha/beta fold hydrolase [Anaerolineae bacterium]|nr:alpha/beta fold hydrolase [Anaerolineae bacterium]
MKRWVFISLAVLVMLSACTTSVATPFPEAERVPSDPTATPPPSTAYRRLGIDASDGVTLVGAFYPPAQGVGPGVLLLHALGGHKEDWATLATQLQEAGYGVLALDARGHGESGGTFDPQADGDLLVDDVLRAWAVLAYQPEVDPERTAMVGASIGANLGLRAAALEPTVRAVALLSPGLDYSGVRTDDAIVDYGARPILIVASEEDTYAAESALALAEAAQGQPVVTLYPSGGHGTELLGARQDLPALILGWLSSQVE